MNEKTQNQLLPQSSAKVFSLKARALVFLSLLLVVSVLGLGLMLRSQDQITKTSEQIRQILLPAGRLFEEAKGELDLQAQELALLAESKGKSTLSAQDLGLLRVGPAVKSLLHLHESPHMPSALRPMAEPWIKSVRQYQEKIASVKDLSEAISRLKNLRQRTHLLHRAIDREFSVQLLGLSETVHDYGVIWALAFLIATASTLGFLFLLWRWMTPLESMRHWLESHTQLEGQASFLSAPPPPSVMGRGLWAPPAEVQQLVEALRFHLSKFKNLARELAQKSEKNDESEKAMGTLFAGFHYLVRHNEVLLQELIRNERLASMGEMAAQLAHEIRNPLNSLNLKLELLRDELGEEHQLQLDKVLNEIDRLDALTESHLRTTRARLRLNETTPNDANASQLSASLTETIESSIETLAPEIERLGLKIALTLDINTKARALIPQNILKATLINLLKNAVEATQHAKAQGKLIAVRMSPKGEKEFELSVFDQGVGLSLDWLAKPFQSFFTTKENGSGLGLATSKRMLEAYRLNLSAHQAQLKPYVTEFRISGELLLAEDEKADISNDLPLNEKPTALNLESVQPTSEPSL